MKKIKKIQQIKDKNIDVFSRFFISAVVVISFFYVTPIFINFTEKNFYNKEFTNNSKSILNKVLKKDDQIKEEEILVENDERELLYDILEENNSERKILK